MKITNKWNVPEAIARAARRDSYSRGTSRKSVTQLISPPRIDILRALHRHEMETDVTDMLWSLLGTAVHAILEKGAADGHTSEERLYAEVNGWLISGGIDVQILEGRIRLLDYKVTSVWSVMYDKPEWEAQLNFYACLVRHNKGKSAESLQVCAILRDWRRADAIKNVEYPGQPIVVVDIPVWSDYDQDQYVIGRVRLHQEAEALAELGVELPHCSDKERWVSDWGTKWTVGKPDKRPRRIFASEDEAQASQKSGEVVAYRRGEPKRCTGNYCGVRDWCSQFQKEQEIAR